MNARSITSLFVIALYLTTLQTARSSDQDEFSASNKTLVWHSPGLNSLGSMPLGNGDIGLNAWVDKNGDLLFYIAKSDAWCENGRLVKQSETDMRGLVLSDIERSYTEEGLPEATRVLLLDRVTGLHQQYLLVYEYEFYEDL